VEETAIVERARSRGVLGDNLHMLPPAPKREMPLVLGSATVATSLFMPLKPMWNNSANKFFDGLAAAKPMAINYGGWQAELLARSGAGIVLEHSRPDAAATELAALCRDPRRLAQMSAASSRLARTEFHRDRLAEKLERVLLRAHGRAHAHTHVAAAAERKAA
jgi:glycosyltransferase involved in cell wall biosynthesis